MSGSPTRILVVDDYEPFRWFVQSAIGKRPEFQIVGEVSDGLEAVRSAAELQPDLVLLDVGLPKLNGIEAARRIRRHSPNTRILFFSENRAWDIVEEALSTDAMGYVAKSDAVRDLLPALEAVLSGKQFVSSGLSGHRVSADQPSPKKVAPDEIVGRHELVLYSYDWQLVDAVSPFLGTALKAGNAAIVVATNSHRDGIIQKFRADGVDIAASIEQGRYIALDAADTFSPCIVDGSIQSNQFLKNFSQLILRAANAAKGEHPRVVIFGECSDLMCKQGDADAAIQDEKLCTQLCEAYGVDILCGCSLRTTQLVAGGDVFQCICAEHSVIHYA